MGFIGVRDQFGWAILVATLLQSPAVGAGVKTDLFRGVGYSVCSGLARRWERQSLFIKHDIDPEFRREREEYTSKVASPLLRQHLQTDFAAIRAEPNWLKEPLRSPETDALVTELISLSESERSIALKLISETPRMSRATREALMLALFDQDTWFRRLNQNALISSEEDAIVNALIPVIQRMPKLLRLRLMGEIRGRYLHLHKVDRSFRHPMTSQRLAPKRASDALISILADPAHYIPNQAALLGGSSDANLQAFDQYLRLIKDEYLAGLSIGGISARQILKIAQLIQNELRSNALFTPLQDRWVRWTGSVVNGRGKPQTSDIDVQISHESVKALFPKIDQQANELLRPFFADVHLETHAMRSETTPHFTAQISPIMILITADSIDVEIYAPVRPLFKDRVMLPMNYPAPFRLNLFQRAEKLVDINGKPEDPYHNYYPKLPLPELSVQELKSFLQNPGGPYLENPNSWLSEPLLFPGTQQLVNAALKVPAEQRMSFLNLLEGIRILDSELANAIALALFDSESWNHALTELMTRPQEDLRAMKTLAPIAKKAPQELRKNLALRIRLEYPKLSKVKYVRTLGLSKRYLELAPKRSIDILINALSSAEHLSSFQDYSAYLKELRQTYFINGKNGDYSASDVAEIGRIVQKHLRLWKTLNPGSAALEMLITGSVPNGRAVLDNTDLDAIPSDFKLEAVYPAIQKDIHEFFLKRARETHIEVHSMFKTTTVVNAALINPIVLKVTEERVSLLIYPPMASQPRDRFQLDRNYPKPHEVVIE